MDDARCDEPARPAILVRLPSIKTRDEIKGAAEKLGMTLQAFCNGAIMAAMEGLRDGEQEPGEFNEQGRI